MIKLIIAVLLTGIALPVLLSIYGVIEVEYAIAAVFGILIIGGAAAFFDVRADHPNIEPSDRWIGPIS